MSSKTSLKKYGKLALCLVVMLLLTHLIVLEGCGKNSVSSMLGGSKLTVGVGRM